MSDAMAAYLEEHCGAAKEEEMNKTVIRALQRGLSCGGCMVRCFIWLLEPIKVTIVRKV